MRFKKACGSRVVRVQPSDVGTLILVDAVWSGKFERGEILSPEEALLVKESCNARCASSSPAQIHHPSVKNNARAKRRNVVQEMSDVSPSWRDSGHSKGYLHFSPFPTETAERSPRKNAGRCNKLRGARIHGDLPFGAMLHEISTASINRLPAPESARSRCPKELQPRILDCVHAKNISNA